MVAFLPSEGAMGPFLLLEHTMQHQPTSWKLECSEQVVSLLEMRLLTVLGHNKSNGSLIETHAMTCRSEICQKPLLKFKVQSLSMHVVDWEKKI
jgi:hypothetical protein